MFLEGLTAVLLVVFAGLLVSLTSSEDRGESLGGRILFAAALLTAAVDLSVGLASGIVIVQFAPSSATEAIATLWMVNFADMVVIGFPLAMLFGTAALVIWRTRIVARWIAVVTVAIALAQVVAALGTLIASLQGAPQLPLFLTAWALLMSGGLLFSRRTATMT